MSIFCEDLKSAELSIGAGTGVPLRLNIRVDQATPENMQRLKQVLSNNKGDSDVYLTLIDGEQEVQFVLGPEMPVTRSPALMGYRKASTWEGVFAEPRRDPRPHNTTSRKTTPSEQEEADPRGGGRRRVHPPRALPPTHGERVAGGARDQALHLHRSGAADPHGGGGAGLHR